MDFYLFKCGYSVVCYNIQWFAIKFITTAQKLLQKCAISNYVCIYSLIANNVWKC